MKAGGFSTTPAEDLLEWHHDEDNHQGNYAQNNEAKEGGAHGLASFPTLISYSEYVMIGSVVYATEYHGYFVT
ncbi:MAG: hypothetical protein CND84_00625 [Marine Group II euryarchaeote MED-G35]|nr:MAG: hypothetical protein CND84_00625 [Marine Group II euryarchaeote MED-G35]